MEKGKLARCREEGMFSSSWCLHTFLSPEVFTGKTSESNYMSAEKMIGGTKHKEMMFPQFIFLQIFFRDFVTGFLLPLWMEHLGVAAKPYKHHAKKVDLLWKPTCPAVHWHTVAYSTLLYTVWSHSQVSQESTVARDMLAIVGLKTGTISKTLWLPSFMIISYNFQSSISSISLLWAGESSWFFPNLCFVRSDR